MHTFMDAKLMAKLLRQGLADRGIDLAHGECLDLVATQFGVANWNVLSARITGALSEHDHLPAGWMKSGRNYDLYRVGGESGTACVSSKPLAVHSIKTDDFCTLMQSVDATSFQGRRLRLSAEIRTESAKSGASIWLRIDGAAGSLRFENLEHNPSALPVRGDTEWVDLSIVLEIPVEAATLNYGFFLRGEGSCWARSMRLDAVGSDIPVTTRQGHALRQPTNLSFTAVA